jgi:hypothetical protein
VAVEDGKEGWKACLLQHYLGSHAASSSPSGAARFLRVLRTGRFADGFVDGPDVVRVVMTNLMSVELDEAEQPEALDLQWLLQDNTSVGQ